MLKPSPKKLGVTHWSTRLLAERLKISNTSVGRAWRAYGVRPWKAESFRFSTDPDLVGKVTDICGLFLAPPENATVLCVDEKSQIQALDRKQIERTYRDVRDADGEPVELHLVMDNHAAHKHKNIRTWLAEHPRFIVHFTPTQATWSPEEILKKANRPTTSNPRH